MTALLGLLLATSASAATVDRVAAVVNEEVIALSEVYELGKEFIEENCRARTNKEACVQEAELEVLDSLILRLLVRQKLAELGLDVTAEEIERTIDQLGRDNGINDRAQLKKAIESQGMPWAEYREQLTEQLRQMKFNESVIRPRITVPEDEALDRYRRSVRDFDGPPTFELGALAMPIDRSKGADGLVAIVAHAREVQKAVNSGEMTWMAAVTKYDGGMFKTKEEGRLGSFKKGEALPAIEAAALAVEVGQVSEPVVVGESVFLIKLLSFQQSDVLPYEQAKPNILNRLYEEKTQEELERWYQQARREAALRILLEGPETEAP